MNKPSRGHFSSITGKVAMGLVITAIISSINVAPSYGYDDYWRGRGDHDYEHRGARRDHDPYEHRGGRHGDDRYEHRGDWHGDDRYRHGRRHGRDRYRDFDDGYRERVYYGNVYRERIYVPPPVYVEPGLDIFFSTSF